MRDEHQTGIGTLIASLREQQGWSQRELAKAVGLDQSAVSRIEAGRRRVSSAELQRLADLFSVSADALLTSGAPSGPPPSAPWAAYAAAPSVDEPAAGAGPYGESSLLSAIEQTAAPSAMPPEDRDLIETQAHGFEGPPLREHGDLQAGPPGAAPWDDNEADQPSSQRLRSSAPPRMSSPAASEGWGLGARRAAAPPPQARTLSTASAQVAGEWSSAIAGVVRDWFALRALAARPETSLPWSTGQTAEGKVASSARPWRPPAASPGAGDALYDRVARFWRSELHVDPDDGPLPDLVPLLEDGLGIQVIVARVAAGERAPTAAPAEAAGTASSASALHPVAAAFVSDGVPFLFVNAARPVVLQRFALAHGFAHLMLAHGDVVDERIGWSRANPREAAANDFAEELLAPVRAVERWYARRPDLPRNPTLDTVLELANAFGISAWASLFRSRAAGRLSPKHFALLRREMRLDEWQLLPRQAFLGGVRDTLTHLTPQEVLPPGSFGEPAVLRVPAAMRAWALAGLREGRLSLEDAASKLCLEPGALVQTLARLGLE